MAATACFIPRIPQPQSYHSFADQRTILDIPNFWNVASNVPFAIVGWWGLLYLIPLKSEERSLRFIDRRERTPYLILFLGCCSLRLVLPGITCIPTTRGSSGTGCR